jgi:hypothetical protein
MSTTPVNTHSFYSQDISAASVNQALRGSTYTTAAELQNTVGYSVSCLSLQRPYRWLVYVKTIRVSHFLCNNPCHASRSPIQLLHLAQNQC